jgi:sorting nexin-25
MIANHENEEWINGEKTEDIVAFLDRLYTAKRKVEKRIVVLGGESEPVCALVRRQYNAIDSIFMV